jgi:ABC-type phosphate/phosphonate transport system substrate-binding protein
MSSPQQSAIPLVSLAMYPFAQLDCAYDELWGSVHRQLSWSPAHLDRAHDVHDVWLKPALVLAQTCGWPLVTGLLDRVRVLGSFRHTHALSDGYRYRTVIVAREQRPSPADFAGETAAVNSEISLSGWVSLIVAVHGPGGAWTGPVQWTGAHVESLRVLQRGEAMVASIDSVSLSHIRRYMPELLDGLHEVGHGPLVPSLPLITSLRRSDDEVAALRKALAVAAQSADPALLIGGFEPLDIEDYLPLLELGPEVPVEDQQD